MKKYLCSVILIMSLLFLGSCASNKPSPEYDVSVQGGKGDGAIELTVIPIWKKRTITYAISGLDSFAVTVKNNTDSIAKVIWEESSITYGGSSYVPFIGGQRFADAGTPASPMIIPRGASAAQTVHSPGQVYYSNDQYSSGWKLGRINASNVVLVFCIESNGVKEFYTVDIKEKEI